MINLLNLLLDYADRNSSIVLLLAGFFEILWALSMKMSDGFTRLTPTLLTIPLALISAGLLSLAMRTIPMGTAYSIWVGIGVVGTFILGLALFGESVNTLRILSIALIVAGIVGLKLLDLKA